MDSGGRQRTPTDGLSQAGDTAALAVGVFTWRRDEEANPSGASMAKVARHVARGRRDQFNDPVLRLLLQ